MVKVDRLVAIRDCMFESATAASVAHRPEPDIMFAAASRCEQQAVMMKGNASDTSVIHRTPSNTRKVVVHIVAGSPSELSTGQQD